MIKIYYACTKADDEAFFDEQGNLLAKWGSEANWHGGVFDALLEKLGVEVIYPRGNKFKAKLEKLLKGND